MANIHCAKMGSWNISLKAKDLSNQFYKLDFAHSLV